MGWGVGWVRGWDGTLSVQDLVRDGCRGVGFGWVLWMVGDVSGVLVVRLVVDVLVGG